MVTMKTAYTVEIDDEKAALAEITGQLGLAKEEAGGPLARLCIVHCHRDYCATGLFEALSEYLDANSGSHVNICGITTASSGGRGQRSDLGISLCVLESANVSFKPSYTPTLTVDRFDAEMDAACAPFREQKPDLILGYFPVLSAISGERMISAIDSRCGGSPLFGGLASSESSVLNCSGVIYDGKLYKPGVVLVGLYGDVRPEFFTANVLASDVVALNGKVTKAHSNVLVEINGEPAFMFLKASGFIKGTDALSLHAVPMVFTFADGSYIIRNPVTTNMETGEITMTGEVPLGADVSIAIFNSDVIKTSAEEGLRAMLEKAPARAALVYSCMVRRWLLMGEDDAEQRLAASIFGTNLPYTFAYVGGEMFPTAKKDGGTVNLLQNESIIVCAL